MSAAREPGSGTRDAGDDEEPLGRPAVSRWKLALLGVVGVVVLAAPLWAPYVMRHMEFFRVRRIEIVGARYVAPSDILSRLNVDTLASIWDPTKPLAARIATHPQIQTVTVGRKLP